MNTILSQSPQRAQRSGVHESGGTPITRSMWSVRADGHDDPVPGISEFYGIVIEMYFADHPPPHFHARYGGEEATIVIASGELLAGSLPGRALRLVREWLREHRNELEANWDRARNHEAPEPVAPLR